MSKLRLTIILVLICFAFLAFIQLDRYKELYAAEAIIIPSTSNSSILSKSEVLNFLPGNVDDINASTFRSNAFYLYIIEKRDLEAYFFAIRQRGFIEDIISEPDEYQDVQEVIDENVYSVSKKQWMDNNNYTSRSKLDSIEMLKSRFSLNKLPGSNLYELSVESPFPILSEQLLIWLIDDINTFIRSRYESEILRMQNRINCRIELERNNNNKKILYKEKESILKLYDIIKANENLAFKRLTLNESNREPTNLRKGLYAALLTFGLVVGYWVLSFYYQKLNSVWGKNWFLKWIGLS